LQLILKIKIFKKWLIWFINGGKKMKIKYIIFIVGGSILAISILMIGMPLYIVWQQGLAGQASLNRAQQERKILVEQAKAEKESASIRAEAIAIVGKAAQEYPEYRLQEFLGAFAEALQNGNIEKIIYVPTEANIPIMEASRFK
jgi:hypothetical protein